MRILSLCLIALALPSTVRAGSALTSRQWTVDGVAREAMVSIPASASTLATPVLFAFHGHGGRAQNMAALRYHLLWPEAIVVYPEGLNTPALLIDPQGLKTGWQLGPGFNGDRDLKFFDAMLSSFQEDFRVDDKRIYVTGHSNGGGFAYALWAARGPVIAAVAPTSSAAVLVMPQLAPKPVFIAGGTNDQLVKFSWQQATIDALLRLNQCDTG